MIEDPNDTFERRSRSAKKRDSQAIEALAVRMVESSGAACKRLPLSEELRKGLDQARSITNRKARKRELKHLAGLLRRDEDAAIAIQTALDTVGRSDKTERDRFHRIEELRDAMCDPELFSEALKTAEEEAPGLDRHALTRLAVRVHQSGDKRASREIFRRLRELMEAPADD